MAMLDFIAERGGEQFFRGGFECAGVLGTNPPALLAAAAASHLRLERDRILTHAWRSRARFDWRARFYQYSVWHCNAYRAQQSLGFVFENHHGRKRNRLR